MYDERIDMGLTTTYWCDECEKPVPQRELVKVTIAFKARNYGPHWYCEECLEVHGFILDPQL